MRTTRDPAIVTFAMSEEYSLQRGFITAAHVAAMHSKSRILRLKQAVAIIQPG
jgi:hypothetical protein